MTFRLYEIPAVWGGIEMDLEGEGGDLTPQIEARIANLLASGAEALENAMKVVKSLEAQAGAAQDESQRLQGRAASFKNKADRLRGLILPALQTLGGKIKTPLFTFSTQTRHNVAFAVNPGVEMWELPAQFIRVPPAELNKTELKRAEAAGETLPVGLAVSRSTSTSLMVR